MLIIFWVRENSTREVHFNNVIDNICKVLLPSISYLLDGFSGSSAIKNLPAMQETLADEDLIPGSGRSPGEGNGNPIPYSCLENPMDIRAWQVTVHDIEKESDTTEATEHAYTVCSRI